MKTLTLILELAKKLSEALSRAITIKKIDDRRDEHENIKENPDDYQSSLFGPDSGGVSVSNDDEPID